MGPRRPDRPSPFIDPIPLGADFAYAIDPEGPVYLVFVAREAPSKRRGLATASWTEASGAKFTWAPPEIAKLGSDSRSTGAVVRDGEEGGTRARPEGCVDGGA